MSIKTLKEAIKKVQTLIVKGQKVVITSKSFTIHNLMAGYKVELIGAHAVAITHKATGLTVVCNNSKSAYKNRKEAQQKLEELVKEHKQD
jgi:hypothetical protein